jgi:hypothetical protein
MFTSNDKHNTIRGAAALFSLIVACLLSVVLYKQLVPKNVEHDTINITREDYEQALAKWQANRPRDYELTLERSDHEVTLRISTELSTTELVQWLYLGRKPDEENDPPIPVELLSMTVEELFALVDDSLSTVNSDALPREDEFEASIFYDFEVALDEALGYPTHLAWYRRLTKPARELTWRQETQDTIDVKALKVLR